MAFGPSIVFVAPNWEPDVLRSSEPKGSPVPADPFRSWLRNVGFVQHPGPGTHFTREPIDLYVHRVDEEVAFATIEFSVVPDAPERVSGWQTLVEEMCEKWGFSLTDMEKRAKVPIGQFRRILAQDRIWQIFAEVHGWPPIWPEPLDLPSAKKEAGDSQPQERMLHESHR